MSDAWEQCDDEDTRWVQAGHPEAVQDLDFYFESYPFHMSFDELVSEVYAWGDDVDEWYAKLPDYLKGRQDYV